MFWLLPWESNNEMRHWPWATWALLLFNVSAFMLAPGGSPEQVEAWFFEYGLVPGDWRWYQFVTSAFMHGDWLHLAGNMFFLWVFGDNVEDALGPAGFLLVYALGGLAGDMLFVNANPEMMVPSVGASGCLAAVAGAYGVLFFSRTIDLKVMMLVFPIYTLHVQAFWVLLFFFAVDVFRTVQGQGVLEGGGGVNFVAHGAGFLFGLAVGSAALAYGVMRRYESLGNGSGWWGYLPVRLEEEARLEQIRAMQRERTRAQYLAERERR